MNYIGKVLNNVRDFYNDINAATLTGAIDVVVVEQPDGTFTCSPFHVRFGKLGVLRSREKVVDIEVNGEPLDFHMKLGESGEAFFVEEVPFSELEACPAYLACSPIPSEGEQLLIAQFGDGKSPVSSPDTPPTEVKKDLPPLSPLHEDRPSETVHQPKTFKAETLGDLKQSEVEFRPIQSKKQDEGETNSGSNGNGGNDSGPSGQQPVSKNARRKKRRKSMHKKKQQQQVKKSSPEAATGADDEEETDQHSRSATPPPPLLPAQSSQGTSSEQIRDEDIQFDMEDVNEIDSRVSATLVSPAPLCTLHCGGIMLSGEDDSAELTYSRDCVDCARRCSQIGIAAVAQVSQDSEVTLRPKPADLHFFSDTEGSPGHSPRGGSPTPQSDSELELRRQSSAAEQTQLEAQLEAELGAGGGKQSWKWGELPSPPPQLARLHSTEQTNNEQAEQVSTSEQQEHEKQAQSTRSSVLSGMWSLMRSQNRQRAASSQEGVYLDDLNVDTLDPEVAALYFPHSYRGGHRASSSSANIVEVHNRKPSRPSLTDSGSREEEDAESGKGPSLSQSPHSVEGAIGGPKLLDSDYEDRLSERTPFSDLALSLCGPLDVDNPPSEAAFDACVVSHEELRSNPSLLEHPALIVRMLGQLHTWREAAPQVLSLLIFQQPLANNQETPENSTGEKQLAAESKGDAVGECEIDSLIAPKTPGSDESSPTTDTPTAEQPARGYSWFSWRRSGSASKKNDSQEISASMPVGMLPSGGYRSSDEDELAELTKGKSRKEDSKEGEGYSGSNSSDESETGISIPGARLRLFDKGHIMYRKTLRLSSEQIGSLTLKEGANEVVFSVTTAYQGTSRCKCHVYRWRWDDKIVISDIDGTITKSDVLGHILPIVGKDWAQSGVAQLFTKIKNNGYRLLYLSARAIGQARVTREYLKSIKQGDLSLPEGPLLLSPTSLISAFHREVIEKKPEEFKISCLRDIQALFPNECKPFYAGYGNKINDVWAYRAVGIPIFRIFTINHKGELKHELTQTFQSSYSNMSYIVDQMFPPPPEDKSTTEDFNSFNYWRDPIPELDPNLLPPAPATTPQAKGGKTPVKESPSAAGSPTK